MIRALKSFGQNFLIDKNIIKNIINAVDLKNDDIVLEIGPGHGEITKYLVDKAKKVIVCEIDKYLTKQLIQCFSGRENIEIINCDFLKLDLKKLFEKDGLPAGEAGSKFKIIGNLPYYISSPIVACLLENKKYIDSAYLMLQKEFVRRIIYSDKLKGPAYRQAGKGAFSFFVQYHSKPCLLFDISKKCFRPVPKVDSSFIKLEMKESLLSKGDEELFFKIVRRAFQQRRKSLRNSLKEFFPKDILLNNVVFDFNLRPEALNQGDFFKLVDLCKKY